MVARIADRIRVMLALLGPLGAGSSALLTRLISRFGGWWVIGGTVVAFYTALRYRTAIAWMLAVWCAAAWMHAPGKAHDDPERAAETEPAEHPKSDPQEVYAATLEWIRGQIGERNGIHLSQLLAHAHTHGLHTDLDVPAFRAVLEQWGFPVRQQLKVGRRNRPGIHRDDLPKPPLPATSPEDDEEIATSVEYQP